MKKKISKWWKGEYIAYENEPDSGFFVIDGNNKYHWTAKAVRKTAFFLQKEWKWVIGTILASLALLFGFLSL